MMVRGGVGGGRRRALGLHSFASDVPYWTLSRLILSASFPPRCVRMARLRCCSVSS